MYWQKTATARGETTDGGGNDNRAWSVGASRLWADGDHAAQLPAWAGAGSQSGTARAFARTRRRTAALGLSLAIPRAPAGRRADQSQAGGGPLSRARAIVRSAPQTQATESAARATLAPSGANQAWAMDFIHDSLWSGRRYRALAVIDEWSRESLAIEVDVSLTGERVKRVLERLRLARGLPAIIQVDNELSKKAMALNEYTTAVAPRASNSAYHSALDHKTR